MLAEPTQEDIVTKLLSSNEIIKQKKGISCDLNKAGNSDLGSYLLNPPKEELPPTVVVDNTYYSFVRQGGWKY